MGKKIAPVESSESVYSAGRELIEFASPYSSQDKTIAGLRLDGQTISGADCKHCTFINVSFKEVKLGSGNFDHCIFV